MPNPAEHFLSTYKKLDRNSLDLLNSIYTSDIVFEDPIHLIKGLNNLHHYFEKMYENIIEINFEFHNTVSQHDNACIQWTMRFRHPKLARRRTIGVEGASFIRFSWSQPELVEYHRDYFDLGAMLYEHIPVIGSGIRFLKHKISQ